MTRINAWLARGLSRSRRDCDDLIRSGQVTINGLTASFHHKVAEGDDVRIRGQAILPPKKTFILFNKPRGWITAVRDSREKTVMSLLPPRLRSLFPVGRLDRETRGLLLFTNDGVLAQRIAHPSHGVLRRYRVELNRQPDARDLARTVKLADGPSRFESPRIVSQKPPVIEVGLREGRKRQIRLTLQAMGYRVLDLARTHIGDIQLGSIPEGEWRELTSNEVERLLAKKNRPEPKEKKDIKERTERKEPKWRHQKGRRSRR